MPPRLSAFKGLINLASMNAEPTKTCWAGLLVLKMLAWREFGNSDGTSFGWGHRLADPVLAERLLPNALDVSAFWVPSLLRAAVRFTGTGCDIFPEGGASFVKVFAGLFREDEETDIVTTVRPKSPKARRWIFFIWMSISGFPLPTQGAQTVFVSQICHSSGMLNPFRIGQQVGPTIG